MVRVKRTTLTFQQGQSPGQSAALSRQILAAVASRLPPGLDGRAGRVHIEVRVPAHASNAAIEERAVAAVTRRIALRRTET